MKKILIICVLIISFVFISGCTIEDKTNSETFSDSQINQQSDTETPDLIIKPRDVPGLSLEYYTFTAVPKSSIFTKDSHNFEEIEKYEDVLPLGTRNVGESSIWRDKSGRELWVGGSKFDSISGLKEEIETMQQNAELAKDRESMNDVDIFNFGDPNIGDTSFYTEAGSDVIRTDLTFIYKNNYVSIMNLDEKAKSKNEAIRIAKIIKNRLD